MKKIIFIMSVIVCGCTDMLDQKIPTGPTGDDFFKTERDVQLAVVAAYAGLTNAGRLWGQQVYNLELLGDHLYNGSTDGGRWHLFQYNVKDAALEGFYQYSYIAINRANQVIVNAPLVEGISQQNLDNYLGQVRFLRGYLYFLLTQLFEEAPIVLSPPGDPAGFTIAASSAAEVYAQAIADLELAEQLLPATQADEGRVTRHSASAMLAKVFLFGADELKKTEWYASARQKAEEVIGSGVYHLINDPAKTPEENFKSLFLPENANGPEDIFTVQHYNDGIGFNNENVGNRYVMSISARANQNIHAWGFGWGYVYESVFSLWDEADARKGVSLWYDGEPSVVNGDTLGYYNQATQQRPNVRKKGGAVQKFWWGENFKPNVAVSGYDMKVLRYAELLLIHAEADLKSNGAISAAGLASINAVRSRAGLPDLTASEVDLHAILEERRWELFAEGGHRWFDLMRTRTAEAAYADILKYDTDGDDIDKNGFVPESHYKLPYPQAALDRNPELVQKAAWGGAN